MSQLASSSGQVENTEVRKRKYRNGNTETEAATETKLRKWEEKLPISVYSA